MIQEVKATLSASYFKFAKIRVAWNPKRFQDKITMTGKDKIETLGVQEVAKELDKLQLAHNDGRGISCVKQIVDYLMTGDIDSAIAVRSIDGDKTSLYPDVEGYLNQTFGCRLHNTIHCGIWLCKVLQQ